MKRVYLKFYAKIVAALLTAFVAFSACCTKKSVEKSEKIAGSNDTTAKKDTVTSKINKFPGGGVIAMYGVRPDELK